MVSKFERILGVSYPRQLQIQNDLVLRLRAAKMYDRPFVDEFFAQLTIRDFRFRLVAGLKVVNPHQMVGRIEVGNLYAEHLLAFDPATGKLAGCVIILADHGLANAEAAVVVSPQFRGRGIGWSLLRHAADVLRERGLSSLRSIETLEDHEPLEIAFASGFQAKPYDADPTLIMVEANLA